MPNVKMHKLDINAKLHRTSKYHSPVKIWEDPPQIATKIKWPPSCGKFYVDFKHKKCKKNQPSGTFSNFKKSMRTLRKTIGKWHSIFLSELWQNILLFTTNMIYIYRHNMIYIYRHTLWKYIWMAGFLINKLFQGLHTKYANSKKNIFHFIVLHDSIFLIPLSIFNRTNWLIA